MRLLTLCTATATLFAPLCFTGVALGQEATEEAQPQAPAPTPEATVEVALADQPEVADDSLGISPPPHAPAMAPSKANITLQADEPMARLERQTGVVSMGFFPTETALATLSQWETVCVAPCAIPAEPNSVYRVSGDGLVPSTQFTSRGQDLELYGDMGDSYARTGGAALAVMGIGGVLLGGVAVVAVPIMESEDVASPEVRTGVLAGGLIVMGAGTVAAATGIYLWFANDTEVIDQNGMNFAHVEVTEDVTLSPEGVLF